MRDNTALLRDPGTEVSFAGQSRGMRDGWQVCPGIIAVAQPYKRQAKNYIEVFSMVMLNVATIAFLPQSINDSPLEAKSLLLFNCIFLLLAILYLPITIVIILVRPWKTLSQVRIRMQLKITTLVATRQGYGSLQN